MSNDMLAIGCASIELEIFHVHIVCLDKAGQAPQDTRSLACVSDDHYVVSEVSLHRHHILL